MKKATYLFFVFFLIAVSANAQTPSIINDLNSVKQNEGRVVIYQDEAIANLVGKTILTSTPNASANNVQLSKVKDSSTKKYVRAKGYRIQVYTGNDQKTSKSEAESRKRAITSVYPNMEVTVGYTSPIWKVKAGNFRTQEEAKDAIKQMSADFPRLAREMNVISDAVNIAVE